MTGQRDPVTPPPAARMPRASWYWGAAALLMALWLLLAPPQAGQELPYSQFKAMLHAGRVIDLQLDERQISGKLRPAAGSAAAAAPQPFYTWRVSDAGLTAELDKAGVSYAAAADRGWIGSLLSWVMPALALLLIWNLLGRQFNAAGGGLRSALDVGKSHARRYS